MTYRAVWGFKARFLAAFGVLTFLAFAGFVGYLFWGIIASQKWSLLVMPLLMSVGAGAWLYGLLTTFESEYRLSFDEEGLEWSTIGPIWPTTKRVRLRDIRWISQLRPEYGLQRIKLLGEKRDWILRGFLSEGDAHAVMQAIFDRVKAQPAAGFLDG